MSLAISSFSARVAHVDAHQRLRPLHGLRLGEVHDVDRRLMGLQQLGQRLGQRRRAVLVRQRHGAGRGAHDRSGTAGAAGQILLEALDITQRRGHQNELRLRQLQQRDLPRPAPVGLGVEVELVHHHLADVGVRPVAQRDGGEHLGGAADDGGVGVDRGVTGEHADVLGAEELAQVEELLRDQRLDRGGVEGDLVLGECGEVRPCRDQTLAGAGRGRQDHVRPGDHLDQRLLLGGIQRDAPLLRPPREGFEEGIGIGVARHLIDKRGCHAPILPAAPADQGTGRPPADHWTLRCVAERASDPGGSSVGARGAGPAAGPRHTRHEGQGGDTHDGTGALAFGGCGLARCRGRSGCCWTIRCPGLWWSSARCCVPGPRWLQTSTTSPPPFPAPSARLPWRCAEWSTSCPPPSTTAPVRVGSGIAPEGIERSLTPGPGRCS